MTVLKSVYDQACAERERLRGVLQEIYQLIMGLPEEGPNYREAVDEIFDLADEALEIEHE